MTIESFYHWVQQVDWPHIVAVGFILSFLAIVRAIGEHVQTAQESRRISRADAGKSESANAAMPTPALRSALTKWFPLLRMLLFFAAVVVVLMGVQEIYAALNPRGPYRQPEVSWVGALLVAAGAATLWFGRPWLSKK